MMLKIGSFISTCHTEEQPVLSSNDIAHSILDDILDNMFPAEVAAEHVMDRVLYTVDSEIWQKGTQVHSISY